MTDIPVFILNARQDFLAANQLGEAFYVELFAELVRPANSARFVFLNPRAAEFFLDWDTIANDIVGILRTHQATTPTTYSSPT